MIWLIVLVCLPPAAVAGRDLALNWKAVNPEIWQSWAHGRARAAAVAFAVAAVPLYTASPLMSWVFWAFAMLFTFVLLPNRVLTEPPTPKRKPKRDRQPKR